MRLAATESADGHVEISFPDGSTGRSSDPDLDERVSAAIDHPVRLEPLRPVVRDLGQNVGVYGRVVTPGAIASGDRVTFQ